MVVRVGVIIVIGVLWVVVFCLWSFFFCWILVRVFLLVVVVGGSLGVGFFMVLGLVYGLVGEIGELWV